MGGGDVKLISAVALGEPIDALPAVLISIALAGGGLALFYLVRGWYRRRGRAAIRQLVHRLVEPRSPRLGGGSDRRAAAAPRLERGLPYGVAVLLGVVWHQSGMMLACFSGDFC